jgi:hypothetical protein
VVVGVPQVGVWSSALARRHCPSDSVGRFSDGMEQPATPAALRVGSFADGYTRIV